MNKAPKFLRFFENLQKFLVAIGQKFIINFKWIFEKVKKVFYSSEDEVNSLLKKTGKQKFHSNRFLREVIYNIFSMKAKV